MPKHHRPRHGSLQFWPRKRAKRSYARIRSWPTYLEGTKLLAFIGYKAGMTHVMLRDNNPNSITKGQIIQCPATIIECPPIKPLSIRFYQKTNDGLKLISEIFSEKIDKEIKRKTKLSKTKAKEPEQFDEIRLVVHSQPKLTGIGKKKPDILEVGISGKDTKEKLTYIKSLLGKEIKLNETFKEGQFLDIHAITKGKGFAGAVKRYGVKIRQHKSEKTKRGTGVLGAWTPKRVSFTVPQPGRMGNHQRTEYNKLNLKIGSDPKEINPAGGFTRYGLVKNDYMLIKGSIPGSIKRTIVLSEPMRQKTKPYPVEITLINK